LAESYGRGDNGLKNSYEMAAHYFAKACNMQNAFGCVRMVNVYYFGNLGIVEKHLNIIKTLAQKKI
jgi:TPR repeat protein